MSGPSAIGRFLKVSLRKGRRSAKRGAKNGFFHIIGGNVLVKFISAFSVLLFPRIMGGDYGTFKLAENLLGYLLIFNGCGAANAVMRYCAAFDSPAEQNSYFRFSVRFGLAANVGLIAVFCGILYIPGLFGVRMVNYGAGGILASMLAVTFFDFLFAAAQNFLRTNRENKEYGKNAFMFSALYALVPLFLAFLFGFFSRSMEGAVIGRYLAYAAALLLVWRAVRRLPSFREKPLKFSRGEKTEVAKYAVISLAANAFSYVMPYNESIILSVMVTKALYSDFQVAQLLPQSIQYLSTAVIVYIFPAFAKNYLDGRWIFKNTKKVLLAMSVLMGVITLLGILFAPQIVPLFGARFKTDSAVRLMRLMFLTFGLNSAVRMPVSNILAAIGEVRYNVANAIFSSTVHLAVCYAFIRGFGINGAAFGLLIGYVVSSAAAVVYLKYYCNKLGNAH